MSFETEACTLDDHVKSSKEAANELRGTEGLEDVYSGACLRNLIIDRANVRARGTNNEPTRIHLLTGKKNRETGGREEEVQFNYRSKKVKSFSVRNTYAHVHPIVEK